MKNRTTLPGAILITSLLIVALIFMVRLVLRDVVKTWECKPWRVSLYATAISYQDDMGTPISIFVSRTDDQELTGRWIRTIGSPWFVQFGKAPLSSVTARGKTIGWYYHLFISFWVTAFCYLAVLAVLIVRLLKLYRRWESNHGVHDTFAPRRASAS